MMGSEREEQGHTHCDRAKRFVADVKVPSAKIRGRIGPCRPDRRAGQADPRHIHTLVSRCATRREMPVPQAQVALEGFRK
jgi:hypothetical protein